MNGEHAQSDIPEYARGYENFEGRIGRTFDESRSAWPQVAQAAEGAPNIIVVVIDDMGYSDLGPFGGEIDTPAIDSLAESGVVLNNYHTASVCSPARAALLTGVNPHRAGFATVAGFDPGFPGYVLELAEDTPTLAESLQSAGYATFGIGKWHLTHDHATHEGAPRRSWPVQRGFDQYYGCLEGFTSFFAPNRLVRDNTTVEVDRYPDDYYLTDDLTDQAISMIRALRSSEEEKPFFLYFAHNAMHGPLGAKEDDLAKYRGKYSGGWDALRRDRFERQKKRGLFPADTEMVESNVENGYDVAAWDSLSDSERATYERYMEVYAAMVDNLDQNLARILDTVRDHGELDNTIVVVTSDNGGTAEGGPTGTRSYFSQFINHVMMPENWERDRPVDPELIGGPQAMVHYPRGWAMASNTPFRFYKGSTFAGGVRVPFVFSWPDGLKRGGSDNGVRNQYMYATDLLPTLLDAAGVKSLDSRHGVPAKEIDGRSAFGFFQDAGHDETHREQYAEWGGHRGFYQDGWKILTMHERGVPSFDDTEWQLYNVREDPTEMHNLAVERPEKLAELAAEWERAAWGNTVFPMAAKPALLFAIQPPEHERFSRPVTLFPGTPTVERARAIELIGMRSFDVEIRLDHKPGDQGVLVAHGDQGGGYVLYIENGEIHFEYNEYGIMRTVSAEVGLVGSSVIGLSATLNTEDYHWDFTVSMDGEVVAGLQHVMMLMGLAPYTGIDIGIDRRGPVSWEMHQRHGSFPFTGALTSVRYVPGPHAPYDAAPMLRAKHLAARIYD